MTRTAPPPLNVTAVLADGRTLTIRPLLPSDDAAYRQFVEVLSPRSQYYRFFSARHSLSDREILHFLNVDHRDREALVAVHGTEIVAVARYDRDTDLASTAEVAFIVRDDFQGQGIGPRLLRLLAAVALDRDIRRFVATVLPDNRPMLTVFAHTGWVTARGFDDGAIAVVLDIDRDEVRELAANPRDPAI